MSEIVVSTQVAEYSQTAAGLAELRNRLANVVHDVTTTAGMEAARKDRRECVGLRTSLEAKRVELKAPALERCKLIDAEAKRITGEIWSLESPIDSTIKVEEDRKAREKAEREQKERQRIAEIHRRIEFIRSRVVELIGESSADVQAVMAQMEPDGEIGSALTFENYAELLPIAIEARDGTLAKLREMHAQTLANEQEAARLKTEREAFAAQKKEQDRLDEIERDRLADEARAAKKARDDEAKAERKRLDHEARAAREQREAADRQAKLERDEQDRIAKAKREADEKADRERKAALDKQQAEIDRRQREHDEREHRAEAHRQADEKRKQDALDAENARLEAERLQREETERAEAARAESARLRAIAFASAKRPTLAQALEQILFVAGNRDDYTDAEAREEISILAEANLSEMATA